MTDPATAPHSAVRALLWPTAAEQTRRSPPPAPPVEGSRGGAWLIAAVIGVIGVLYALAMFPGLEWHSGYFGRAFKAIHPDSFPGDPYLAATNPINRSSYYVLVRLVGELWLDDRFTIVVYAGLVLLALPAVDRLARAFGADRLSERLGVLALLSITHRFRTSLAEIVTWADFYAGTFAGVAALWLLALAVDGAPLVWQAALTAVLASINIKWAWLPIVMAWTVTVQRRFNPRQQRLIAAIVLVLALAGVVVYRAIRPVSVTELALFSDLLRMEATETNPWLDPLRANALYWLLLAAGWWLTPPRRAGDARAWAAIGAGVWLLSGAYLRWAPGPLRIPTIVMLSFNRATQWPILALYITVGVAVLTRLQTAATPAARTGWVGAFLVLFGTAHGGRIAQAAALTGAIAGLVAAWRTLARRVNPWTSLRDTLRPPAVARVVAGGAVAAVLIMYGRAAWTRRPALAFLAQHGVIGDNPSAKWVGVDAYIRAHTPPDARLFPIATYDYPWRRGLRYEGSLRTRTGRTMPVGPQYAVMFSRPALKELAERGEQVEAIIAAWGERNGRVVRAGLDALAIDYVVADCGQAEWFPGPVTTFAREARVNDYCVFRRVVAVAPPAAPAPEPSEDGALPHAESLL